MMKSLIIVPFLLELLPLSELSRFSSTLSLYRKSLSFRHNDTQRF